MNSPKQEKGTGKRSRKEKRRGRKGNIR